MLEVRVRVPVKSSEDPRKVEKALRAVFPDAVLQAGAEDLVASTDSLDRLRDLIWREKILDAARRVLLGSIFPEGDRARFDLSKQAAYAGHLSFAVGEAPLGDIVVDVRGADLESRFKEMAPPTLRGRPVSEEEYERHLEARRKKKAHRVHLDRSSEE